MKLSTLTAEDLSNIDNFFFDRLGFEFSDLESMPSDKKANLIVEEFKENSNFYALFDYNSKELSAILQGLDNTEIFDSVANKVTQVIETINISLQSLAVDTPTQSVAAQQYIAQQIADAEAAGTLQTKVNTETINAKARRLNINVDQLNTLLLLTEKTAIPLKIPMATKDRNGKRAKAKNVKFISFNSKFDKGIVFLEYPNGKQWLPFSMGASEFFRKTNIRLRKGTAPIVNDPAPVANTNKVEGTTAVATPVAVEPVRQQPKQNFPDYSNDPTTLETSDNPYSLDGFGGTDDLSSDSGVTYQAIVAETAEQQQIANQQFIQQTIEEAEVVGEIVDVPEETEAAKARRMNITVQQLNTLYSLKEKQLISLKTPMTTKNREGKNAKAPKIKFVSFNDKFAKGIVFLEYPHLKGWLVFSMGVSEFFRKTNLRLK